MMCRPAALAVALIAAAGLARAAEPAPEPPPAAWPAVGSNIEAAARALDGDTIEVAGERVRLFGIDASVGGPASSGGWVIEGGHHGRHIQHN